MIFNEYCYLKRRSAINDIKENNNAIWGPKYCTGIITRNVVAGACHFKRPGFV